MCVPPYVLCVFVICKNLKNTETKFEEAACCDGTRKDCKDRFRSKYKYLKILTSKHTVKPELPMAK